MPHSVALIAIAEKALVHWTVGGAAQVVFREKIMGHSITTLGKNAASKMLDQTSASLPECPTGEGYKHLYRAVDSEHHRKRVAISDFRN